MGEQRTHQTRWESGTPAPSYYGYDAHGNVRLLADGNRVVTDRYEYDAFGNLLNVSGTTFNSFFCTGEQLDPTMGLYNLRARWYGPRAGRFATRDTFEGVLTRPLSQGPYLYAESDPVSKTDPSGRGSLLDVALTDQLIFAGGLLTIASAESLVLANTGTSPIARSVECLLNVTASALQSEIVLVFPDLAAQPLTGPCTLPLPIQRGRQGNVKDTGVLDQIRDLADELGKNLSTCELLQILLDRTSDKQLRRKIVRTMKAFGCRNVAKER